MDDNLNPEVGRGVGLGVGVEVRIGVELGVGVGKGVGVAVRIGIWVGWLGDESLNPEVRNAIFSRNSTIRATFLLQAFSPD